MRSGPRRLIRSSHRRGRRQVLTNFRQELTRAVRLGNVGIATSLTGLVGIPAQRMGGDGDDRNGMQHRVDSRGCRAHVKCRGRSRTRERSQVRLQDRRVGEPISATTAATDRRSVCSANVVDTREPSCPATQQVAHRSPQAAPTPCPFRCRRKAIRVSDRARVLWRTPRASSPIKGLLRPIGHFIVCPGKIQKVLPTLGALGIRCHGAAFVGCLSPASDFCFFLFPLVGH